MNVNAKYERDRQSQTDVGIKIKLTATLLITEVLSEINAIEKSSDIETIFMLGDFNVHPSELFDIELSNFCTDRS